MATMYVDELRDYGVRYGRAGPEWCHLTTNGTRDELHDFAQRLGLKRSYFQARPIGWHYDLTRGARERAVSLGAVEVKGGDWLPLLLAMHRATLAAEAKLPPPPAQASLFGDEAPVAAAPAVRRREVARPAPRYQEPLGALAKLWSPRSLDDQRYLDEALVPTLQGWARSLLGQRDEPTCEESIYATAEGLRHYLLHWQCADRPGHPITNAMSAYAWHRRLSAEERHALAYFAEHHAAPPQYPIAQGQ